MFQLILIDNFIGSDVRFFLKKMIKLLPLDFSELRLCLSSVDVKETEQCKECAKENINMKNNTYTA